eukprot:TRINITY_DN44089_c0_g1_i1.p1 TRINITY_DN44089_c0_g1~~TRINITY_DN44089_c0_g1_i1.p1  ORF type:complete len:659 (+),score=131.70 TRINITY_DN44089_c0_g1_i1:63-2039(+)
MADSAVIPQGRHEVPPATPAKPAAQEVMNEPMSSTKASPPPPSASTRAEQKVSKKDVAKQLAQIIEGISSPVACSGSLNTGPTGITIRLPGDAAMSVVVEPPPKPERPPGAPFDWNWKAEAGKAQEGKLKTLVAKMPQAAFGHGKETKVDTTVRDALQLQATSFEVDVPQAALDDILAKVRAGLHLDMEIVAERYSLNVYRQKGHFLKHKDTPRGDDMLGTLVLCLPSYYTGGAMKVTQAMQEHKFFDGGSDSGYSCYGSSQEMPKRGEIKWCAFFSDVDHEILKVTSGVRVTLAYLLRRKDAQPAAASIPRPLSPPQQYACLVESLTTALRQEGFMSRGRTLGFPCFHLYTNREVFPSGSTAQVPLTDHAIQKLKGRDAVVARAVSACGLKVSLVPFLGHDYSDDGHGFYQLAKFPASKRVPRRMSDDSIERHFNSVEHLESMRDLWVCWVFDINKAARMQAGDTEWNAEGYFGNEASGISFYVHAALFAKVPSYEGRQNVLAAAGKPKPEDLGDVALSPEHAAAASSDADDDDEAAEGLTHGQMDDDFDGSNEFDDNDDDDDDDDGIFGLGGGLGLDPLMMAMMMMGGMRRPRAKAKGRGKGKAKAKAKGKAKAKSKAKAKAKAKGEAKAKAQAKSRARASGEASRSKRQKADVGT